MIGLYMGWILGSVGSAKTSLAKNRQISPVSADQIRNLVEFVKENHPDAHDRTLVHEYLNVAIRDIDELEVHL